MATSKGFARPVFVLGAGATKACGGPLTKQILPWACLSGRNSPVKRGDRESMLLRLRDFLEESFRLPRDRKSRTDDDYPDLPLLMSMIDDAIDRGLQFGTYDADAMREVRTWLNFAIAEVIRWSLEERPHEKGRGVSTNPHETMLRQFFRQRKAPAQRINPTIISFNYDIIVDNTLVKLGEMTYGTFPDYACDIATEAYRRKPRFGRLLKPHGSLNWMFCPACQRIDLFYAEGGRIFSKAISEFFVPQQNDPYRCTSTQCALPSCAGHVRPVLITPTQAKDYRNPHLAKIWYEAEQALREADRVVIIGYSLPSDDVAIISMLKRSLMHLDPSRITVVELSGRTKPLGNHPVGQRYRWLFGPTIDWFSRGFERWVQQRWIPESKFLSN